MRPRIGRQIAGVCIALTNAYGWDVGVVRVLTVLGFCFSGGLVGIAYLAGWIGIPEEPFLLPGPMSGTYPPNPATNPPSPGAYPPSV
jgi:phage shock protein PspC (stress-responsive transcriptional regulator)